MGSKESRQLASNYAEALSEQAASNLELLEEMYSAIEAITYSIKNVDKANLVFESPAVSSDEKKKILSEIISKSCSTSCKSKLTNFLLLLIDKQRFHILENIQEEFRGILDKKKGLIHAEVSSAKKLDSETIEKIKSRLEKTILEENERVEIRNSIQPELIGGIKIKVKDSVYDGSIKSKLDGIKRRIT